MNITDKKKKKVIEKINHQLSKCKYKKALALISHFKIKNYCITKGKMKDIYKIPQKVLNTLPFNSLKNPHYACAAPMILYLKPEYMTEVLGKYLTG